MWGDADPFAGKFKAPAAIAIGLAMALVATGLRLVVMPWTGGSAPYALSFVAVVAATVLGGWLGGAAAMAGAQALTWLFLIGRPGSFDPLSAPELATFLLATGAQVVIIMVIARYQSALAEAAHEARGRLEELEQRDTALEASEQQMRVVLDSVSDAFYAVDTDWRFTLFNRQAELYFQKSRQEVLGRSAWEMFERLPGSELEQRLREVMDTGKPATFVARGVVKVDRWIETRASRKEDGGLAVAFSDVTERVRLESARNLLIAELNHRVKNTLAIVQSLAQQSFGRELQSDQGRAFEERLITLSRAHSLLTTADWGPTRLADVISVALEPFRKDDERAIRWDGPDVSVPPKTAVTLVLGLHELATNALKYGALSKSGGTVSIEWTKDESGFELTWQEAGGPTLDKPGPSGFGTRMIKRGLAAELNATVELDFRPTGLVCTIRSQDALT